MRPGFGASAAARSSSPSSHAKTAPRVSAGCGRGPPSCGGIMPVASLRTTCSHVAACGADVGEVERLERQIRRALRVVVALEAVTRERRALLGRDLLARRAAARDGERWRQPAARSRLRDDLGRGAVTRGPDALGMPSPEKMQRMTVSGGSNRVNERAARYSARRRDSSTDDRLAELGASASASIQLEGPTLGPCSPPSRRRSAFSRRSSSC